MNPSLVKRTEAGRAEIRRVLVFHRARIGKLNGVLYDIRHEAAKVKISLSWAISR